jgi:hypothetical protein
VPAVRSYAVLTTEITYCPQCILFVFAAMGVYQYVVRDRIRNGVAGENDELLDLDIEQMDVETQLLLLEMLSTDHQAQASPQSDRPSPRLSASQPIIA